METAARVWMVRAHDNARANPAYSLQFFGSTFFGGVSETEEGARFVAHSISDC